MRGREVYAHALTRALLRAEARVTLYVHPGNRFWDDLPARRIDVKDPQALLNALPREASAVLVHSTLPEPLAQRIAQTHLLVGFAHDPVRGAEAGWLSACRLVVPLSRGGLAMLRAKGLQAAYSAPLYGLAVVRGDAGATLVSRVPHEQAALRARLEPLARIFARTVAYERRPGLTLGVVASLVPEKNFPALFRAVGPALARHAVNLEIFGEGPTAHVREIREALAPLGERARFWGRQPEVAAAYAGIDYLLAGLADAETRGLSVLEAQACGVPVLAPNALPYNELIIPGHTGFFYADPRTDAGADFERLLKKLAGAPRPDPRKAVLHLQQFSERALFERTLRLLDHLNRLRIPA